MSDIDESLEERYEWVVDLMSSLAVTNIVKRVLSLATLCMAIIATLEISLGYAATTPIPLALQWASMIFAYVAAIWWWAAPWPTLGMAFTFVIGADICMFIAMIVADIPPAIMLGKTALFIEIGMFVGFFLDRWMLGAHILFCTAATTFIAVYVVVREQVDPLMAFVVWSPVVVSISAFVLLLHFCARSIRLEFE